MLKFAAAVRTKAAPVPATETSAAAVTLLRVKTISRRLVRRLTRRLTATGDERRKAGIARLVGTALLLRLKIRLRLVLGLRLVLLRLPVLLLWLLLMRRLLKVRLRRAGYARVLWHIGQSIIALIIVVLFAQLIGARRRLLRLSIVRVLLREGSLCSDDQAEIVLGVLQVTFGRDRIAGGLRVARELHVLVGDVMGGPADLHVRAVGFVYPCHRVVVAAIAAAHALLLTVIPHGDPFLLHITGDLAGRTLLRTGHASSTSCDPFGSNRNLRARRAQRLFSHWLLDQEFQSAITRGICP